MSIKQEVNVIIDNLPDNATWDDLVKSLIKNKKITLGMTDIELSQHDLSEADVSNIVSRLHSSYSMPDDHRNTKTYNPSNAVTLGMVSGIIAIVFAFIFPPLSWIAAGVATLSGVVGVVTRQEKAWVPILMSIVAVVPIYFIFLNQGA